MATSEQPIDSAGRLRSPSELVDTSDFFGGQTLDDMFVTLTSEEAASLRESGGRARSQHRASD